MNEVVRFLLIILAAFDIGATLAVCRMHYRAWRAAPTGHGLIPLHVWLISASHSMLIFGLVQASALNISTNGPAAPLSWRVWMYLVALVGTGVAVVVIGYYQYRRVRMKPTKVQVEVKQDTEVTDG